MIPLNDAQEEEELNDRGEGTKLRWQNYPKGEKAKRVEIVAITSGAQRAVDRRGSEHLCGMGRVLFLVLGDGYRVFAL